MTGSGNAATANHSKLLMISLLMIALSTGLILRQWQIGESLWLDELHTAWSVAGPLGEIIERAQLGNQSPLYFLLVSISTATFGNNELAVRLPSLLAGLATIAVAFALVLRWTRSMTAAFVVAILVAVDHHAIFYSQEARPYAMVQLLAIIHLCFFWRLQQSASLDRRLTVVLTGALLFWLHYTSALLFAAELCWYLTLRSTTAYRPRQLLTDGFCLLIAIAPTLPHLGYIASHRDDWGMFVHRRSPLVAIQWFSLDVYVAAPLVMVCVALVFARSPEGHAVRRIEPGVTWLTALWFAVPTGLTWLLTWLDITRLFFPRYLIASVTAPIIFAGLTLAMAPSRVWRSAMAVALTTYALLSGGMFEQYRHDGRLLADRNQDWRGAVRWLNREYAAEPLPILVRSGLLEADRLAADSDGQLIEYCLLPVNSFYRLAAPSSDLIPLRTTGSALLFETTVHQIGESGGAWLVINGGRESGSRIVTDIREVLVQHGFSNRILQNEAFGNVGIFQLQVLPQPTASPKNDHG